MVATSLFDGSKCHAELLRPWMKSLVPDGEYFVMVGVHPMVLRKTELSENDVPESHRFYHYEVEDSVYSGIFVGEEV